MQDARWPFSFGEIATVGSALTYGQSDKLIQIQTPVDELTTSGKQIKSILAGQLCQKEVLSYLTNFKGIVQHFVN